MSDKGDRAAKLVEAVAADDAEATAALLAGGGIKIDKQVDGFPPLLHAALHKAKRAARALLDGGADVNARSGSDGEGDRGLTALMVAAETGDLEMIDLLLAAGADPKLLTRQGRGAINFTLETSHGKPVMPIVERLLAAGVPPAGACVARVSERVDLPVARLLLRAGADPNAPSTKQSSNWPGATPLALAIMERQNAEIGREVDRALGREGETDRKRADALELVRELIRAGADVNRDNTMGPPLTLAARANDFEAVRLLLEAGADPSAAAAAGMIVKHLTPLHACVYDKLPEMARLLIDAGADLEAVDQRGRTPLQLARELGYEEVAAFLLGAGAKDLPPVPPPTKAAAKASARRAAGETAKPRRQDRGERGARDFLKMVYGGHPEWAVLMVEAPIDDVVHALKELRGVREWIKDVPVRKENLVGGSPLDEIAVIQLRGSGWTILIRSLFEITSVDLQETPADAAALSKRLKTRAATFMGEDTSSAMGYTLHDRGEPAETIYWSGGEVTKFESTLRDAPADWPRDDFDIADRLFAELGVYLPCCYADATDGNEPYVAVSAKTEKLIERADLVTV